MNISPEQIKHFVSLENELKEFKGKLVAVLKEHYAGDYINITHIHDIGIYFIVEGASWGQPYTDYYDITWDFFADPEAYLEKQKRAKELAEKAEKEKELARHNELEYKKYLDLRLKYEVSSEERACYDKYRDLMNKVVADIYTILKNNYYHTFGEHLGEIEDLTIEENSIVYYVNGDRMELSHNKCLEKAKEFSRADLLKARECQLFEIKRQCIKKL